MIRHGIGGSVELLGDDFKAGTRVLQYLVIGITIDIEVDAPVRVVHMIGDALQALAVDVGVEGAVGTEVISLVDIVVADDVAHADFIPLPAVDREFPQRDRGVICPGDRSYGPARQIDKRATDVVLVEHTHDRETDGPDQFVTLKRH